jgi:6-phosphogluconolactonase/glucosamine-6-phosphate isomerase/deaminase
MQFLREDRGVAITAVAKRLGDELAAGKRVLWLVSGGSNVAAEVEIMSQVCERSADKLQHLAILPMDERYGPRGHLGSNAQMLREAGFDPGEATWVDVLEHNTSFDQTVSFYSDVAATDETTVAGFTWSDYERLTLTPMALTRINAGYLLAYGTSKKDALQRLQTRNGTLSTLPALLLYEIPEMYIYNDQLESEG